MRFDGHMALIPKWNEGAHLETDVAAVQTVNVR
jgi:hypothetical protein